MASVLHYKTRFLNPSETFIERLIRSHRRFEPAGLCLLRKSLCPGLQVHAVAPPPRLSFWINHLAFHLNQPLPHFRSVIRRLRPDVVHAHFGFDGHKMADLCREMGLPLVVSFYGSDVSRLPAEWGWRARYRRLAERMADGDVMGIAASRRMRDQLVELGFPADRLRVVYFGLDPEEFPFRATHSLSGRLMMVGRMVEKKGFRDAIEAIHLAGGKGADLRLDLFGDGPLRPSLERLVDDLGLGGRITFHGMQSMDAIRQALGTRDLLLAPSTTAADGDEEGLPNTILEAMSAGLPVITTPHAAIPEAVEDRVSGFLVPERDPGGLAQILSEIYRDGLDLEPIRLAARSVIVRQHTIQTMVDAVETTYHQLITSHGTVPRPADPNQIRIPHSS